MVSIYPISVRNLCVNSTTDVVVGLDSRDLLYSRSHSKHNVNPFPNHLCGRIHQANSRRGIQSVVWEHEAVAPIAPALGLDNFNL